MKKIFYCLSVLWLSCCVHKVSGQVTASQLKPFIDKAYKLADTSGPGLYSASGDILLKLITIEEYGGYKLVLLSNKNGKLSTIAENESLLLSKDELGTGGGNFPSLNNDILSVDYTLGSGSANTAVCIAFAKAADGHYYFSSYTSTTNNYGVENLFSREQITASQRPKLRFEDATMSKIAGPDGAELNDYKATVVDNTADKVIKKLEKFVPEDFQLASFATGDLNQDGLPGDAVMVVCNKSQAQAMVLLQQNDDNYKVIAKNEWMFNSADLFNAHNFKVVIKNGYFTIEWRVPGEDDFFQHRYITFRYNVSDKQILLHRFDVEQYEGFNPAPQKVLMELTKKQFGSLSFEQMDDLPGIYQFEPKVSELQGTLAKRVVYGPPNYGQTPDKDEKGRIYILNTDYPINVISNGGADEDPEMRDHSEMGIREIQVYSLDKNIDIGAWVGKKVKLTGVFQQAHSGHHYTAVLMEVKKIGN